MSLKRRAFIKPLGSAFAAAGMSKLSDAASPTSSEAVRLKFTPQHNIPAGNYQLRYWSRRPKDSEWISRDVPVLVVDGATIHIDIPYREGEKIASASLEYIDGEE